MGGSASRCAYSVVCVYGMYRGCRRCRFAGCWSWIPPARCRPEAFFSTDRTMKPQAIVEGFVLRWNVEITQPYNLRNLPNKIREWWYLTLRPLTGSTPQGLQPSQFGWIGVN